MVPALPGSRTSSRIATSRGSAARGCPSTRRRELAADRDDALRGDRVGHRLEHVLGDELDLEAGVARGLGDVGVALERRRRHEQLDEQLGAEGERLGDGLRALDEKEPGLMRGRLAWRASPRRAPAANAGCRSRASLRTRMNGMTHGASTSIGCRAIRDAVSCLRSDLGALTSSGRAALAVATRAANVAGSVTARSARMRRSTSMPARPRPWMRRL